MKQPSVSLASGFRLRPWASADALDVVLGFQDALVRRYASVLIDDRSGALAAVAIWSDQWQSGSGAAWAICEKNGQIAGSLRFGATDPSLGIGSVGYWLLPSARGQGVASASVVAATPVVFRRLGWHRIELTHAVENDRSCAVARRADYRAEGTLRSAMVYPDDGRRSDEHLHARLASDV